MDIQSLSPPPAPLTLEDARDILRAFHGLSSSTLPASTRWERAVQASHPTAAGLTSRFVEWLDANGLRQPDSGEGALSLKGVSVVVSKDHPRLSKEEAWRQAALLMAVVDFVNEAPALLAPMRIVDVLLFGSMANPSAVDHGDLDAFVVLEPKHDGATQEGVKFLATHGLSSVVQPNGLSFPSFRLGLMDWLSSLQPFVSLDSDPRALRVLLGENPGFSCYSLMRKSWAQADLVNTTVDESADVVVRCLENGHAHPGARAHIARRLSQATSEMGCSPARRAAHALVSGLTLASSCPLRAMWWATLNPTVDAKELAQVDPDAPGILAGLRTLALKTLGSQDPVASAIRGKWESLLLDSTSSPRFSAL